MAEELFKNAGGAKTQPVKTEPSGNPATPGAQPKQPDGPADGTNQTNSGPSNVTPPASKENGKGDPAQTTQSPEDGKQAPSPTGSSGTQTATEPADHGGTQPQNADDDEDGDNEQPSELDLLKRRADMMKIGYSNNIGVDALKAKIAAAMEGQKPTSDNSQQAEARQAEQAQNGNGDVNALTGKSTKSTKKLSLRQYLINEKMKLVRVRITNLDPKKKDLPGEIITVANEYLGTVRKFVPFGEVTDNGYHIPQCLYDVLKERTFVNIKVRKGSKGEEIVEHQNAREFSLEVLPPLSADELAKLAASQSAAGGL